MKLAEAKGTVVRDGIVGEVGFKIAATAKAFEILSSKLYTDVPRAIVRELSTNAYDAHVDAGKGHVPFKVHLPNNFEPSFEIRDFGNGLSPEEIENVYTVFFASTRSESNEFAGCLGLGSKSPFSYTDQFLVVSHVDGTAYTYSLFKNERGMPTCTKMCEAPTNEPNGILIKIAVKHHDFHSFYEAASKVYSFFKVKPEVTGQNINMDREPSDIIGNDYEVRGGTNRYAGNSLTVVMGQVAYRVSHINLDLHGFAGYDTNIVLYANIGECQTAANREELHIDKATNTWIENKLKAVIEDLRERMKVEAAKATTTLEAVYINNTYAARVRGLQNSITLNGEKKDAYSVRACNIRTDRKRRRSLNVDGVGRDMSDLTRNSGILIIENDSEFSDLPPKIKAKVVYWFDTDPKSPYKSGNGKVYIANITDRQAFLKDFGPPTTSLSKLPDPPKNVTTIVGVTVERNKSCIQKMDIHGKWTNVAEFEDDEEHAIVHRDGNKVIFNGNAYKAEFLHRVMRLCGITTVYGIPTRIMKKYDGSLPEIFELCKEKLEERLSGMTEYELAVLKREPQSDIPTQVIDKLSHLNDTCKDLAEYHKAFGKIHLRTEIVYFADFFNIPLLDKPDYCAIFNQKYPLIGMLESRWGGFRQDELNEIEAYVKFKDNNP